MRTLLNKSASLRRPLWMPAVAPLSRLWVDRRRRATASPWVRRLLITAVLAPLALFWGEMFTRAFFPQNLDGRLNVYASDPAVGFIFEPNARAYEKGREYNALYQINSLGLRDREYASKGEGVFRVLLLGDSFSVSHGLPIEGSLSRQMEKALQQLAESLGTSVKFEVINGAAGGYSPYNYWKAYSRWAPVFKPDLVLVGLSPDDYDCANENARYLIKNGDILAISANEQELRAPRGIPIRRIRKWLSWNSQFYILMRNFLYYNDIGGRITQWRNPGGLEDDSQLQSYMTGQPQNVTKLWSKAFSYLQSLQKETAADGVTLTVIRIPLKIEVDSQQYQQVLAAKGLKKEQIDLDQLARGISALCKKLNVPLLDPTPAMRDRQVKVPCYFAYDGHWNEEGVRVSTISLARQWHDLRLPPWGSPEAKSPGNSSRDIE